MGSIGGRGEGGWLGGGGRDEDGGTGDGNVECLMLNAGRHSTFNIQHSTFNIQHSTFNNHPPITSPTSPSRPLKPWSASSRTTISALGPMCCARAAMSGLYSSRSP